MHYTLHYTTHCSGTLLQAPCIRGTLLQAPYIRGTLLQAPCIRGTLLQAPCIRGTLLQAPCIRGTLLQAPCIRGTLLQAQCISRHVHEYVERGALRYAYSRMHAALAARGSHPLLAPTTAGCSTL